MKPNKIAAVAFTFCYSKFLKWQFVLFCEVGFIIKISHVESGHILWPQGIVSAVY